MKRQRRKLTPLEKAMRDRHTAVKKWRAGYAVFFKSGFQSFVLQPIRDSKRSAEWLRDMLAVALANLVKPKQYCIASEDLDGRHGSRNHIVWEWSDAKNKWEVCKHPDNDWTPDRRKAQRLMDRLRITP